MAEYGVTPQGFARKPLSVIKAEIEDGLRTQFGPDLILSPQSPMGQFVGVFADFAAETWEQFEAIYQSHDPDQAEGQQLDTLAVLRNIYRNGRADEDLRRAITNAGRGSVDVQDISAAVDAVPGVTFSRVYVNSGSETDDLGLPAGRVAVVVEGGEDEAVADAMRAYVAPGVPLYGNRYVDSERGGYCRSIPVVRPIIVPITIEVTVRTRRDDAGCPPPSLASVLAGLVSGWQATRENGRDVSQYTIRQIVEVQNPAVEVVSILASRPDFEEPGRGGTVEIDFTEIAELAIDRAAVVAA